MAAQEKVPTPKEQELAKERLSSCERPTSATLASPFLMSTLGDLMSCKKQGHPCCSHFYIPAEKTVNIHLRVTRCNHISSSSVYVLEECVAL